MNSFIRIIITGVIVFFSALGIIAQPTLMLSNATVASGSITTINTSVMDFTDITKAQYSINWNPTELTFISTKNINTTAALNLSVDNIDVSDVINGNLVFSWEDATNLGVDVEDGMEFFGIEFRAILPEGQSANVIYSSDPSEIIINRIASGNFNIFEPDSVKNGTITTIPAIPDVFFNFKTDTDIFCKGDQVCYDLEVEEFDSIISMQLAIKWSGNVLEFDHAENFGLDRLENSLNVNTNNGIIDSVARAIWGAETVAEFDAGGVSLPNGTTILTMCFNIVGESNEETLIEIGNAGNTIIELIHNDFSELDIISNNPKMTVTDCDNLVIFAAECSDGVLNDTVCINISASNFTDINAARYTLNWDPSILEFIKTDNYNLPELSAANFNSNAGSLVFDWAGMNGVGYNTSDGEILYRACFLVKGEIDQTSFVNFLDLVGNFQVSNAAGEGLTDIRFRDCEIKVLPPKIVVSSADVSAPPNELICIQVNMDNFFNISHIEMPFEWNPAILQFAEIQSIMLPGLTNDNFDFSKTGEGKLQLVGWDSPNPEGVTFNQATDIFYLCFNVIGEIGEISPITFPNTVANPVFIENNNQEPGVTIANGSVTVASVGIALSSDAMEVKQTESFCVDIRVNSFQEIVTMEYTHTWNPGILTFDSIGSTQLEGLTPADIALTADGNIKVSWSSPDFANGTTVEDGSLIYSLCFTPIGDLGDCADFIIADPQEVTSISSQGEDLGIFNNIKNICIDNFGIVNSVVTSPSCDGGDGVLRLDISGDDEDFVYLVQKDGQQFSDGSTRDSIRLENLSEGEYCVVVLAPNANKNTTECFQIGIMDGGIPIPKAGDDIDVGCVESIGLEVQLDGSKSLVPEGGIFSYNWAAINGGQIKPFDENKEKPTVISLGTYILTVINGSNNCFASDTMVVFDTPAPFIKVEAAEVLGCTNSSVQLDAEASEIRENNIHFWTTDSGNFVSDSTLLKPTIDQEGKYSFTIMDTLNGCTVSKDVFVFSDRINPKSEAGDNRQLGCEDDFITLSGEGSSVGQGVTYSWSTPNGSSIVNPDKLDADISRVGIYILTVTNEINGCQASDTMQVLADESLPVARANDLAVIGCGMENVALDGSASSEGISFSYQWLNPNNQSISTEAIVSTSEAGEHLLVVTNIDNDDCIADTAFVNVKIDQTMPAGSITQSLSLSCSSDCSPLTANIPEGDQYLYQWISEEGLVCGGENSPTAMIGAIGLYKFIVIDTINNCADTSSTIVSADATAIVADAGPTRQIGCNDATITLDGKGSTSNENTIFSWTNEAKTEVSSEATAEVSEPGQYTLTVIDTVEGCIAIGKVAVTMNTEMPVANAGGDLEIPGCDFPDRLRLNGSNSDDGIGITYAWFASEGGQLLGDTTIANPEISSPGTFTLTVTNVNNGCSSTDEVTIASNLLLPIANAGADQELSCSESLLTIAGQNETQIDGVSVLWTTTNGNIIGNNKELDLQIDAPGNYTLTISSSDGCTSTDEVVITANLEMPTAEAGESLSISCNLNTFINASGTTGDNIQISWATSDGNIISGADSYTPEVNLGGTYLLTVTNLDNNCTATSEVIILVEEELPLAVAGDNQEICRNETNLAAILPDGNISGIWTTLEKSMIISSNDPATTVADLVEGTNTYIWTLSTEKCPNYSSDTLVVNVPTFPIANEDAFEIAPGQNIGMLDLIANDEINSDEFKINIISPPNTGELNETTNGVFEFITPARYFGSQQFQYEICSVSCSELCDIASVRVVVLPGADVDTTNTLPNAITPNGDGLNDMLLFDELIFDAAEFPKSELIIFNRWGDVVYKASPYNNDWGGKTDTGNELPQGTYYFVLRLDIAEGEIMKGDVTILR